MNDKINQMMQQAGAKFEMMNWVHYDNFDYELFAELIAKECFAAAMQASRGHINPSIMIEEFEKRLGFKVTLPNSRNNSTT